MTEAATLADGRCQALLSSPTLNLGTRCLTTARHELAGLRLCGTHRRIAERWRAEGHFAAKVRYWWELEIDDDEQEAS